ncbi:hypothetical protein [Burkholderia ubonensis]|uniref:hypothetical protein n=1 Tax=Burkholderia ubonensis TaxID=101571 RepID=UPI0008FE1266|nr:hypothetical protein [Burkholderia ubonensis]OJA66786.1 hypothetical protein BGV70_14810 [Burkholderia ubonensis]
MLYIFSISGKVSASELNGYSACSWTDNGNGTSTIKLKIDFKPVYKHTAGQPFDDYGSRGIFVYSYDKDGRLNTSKDVADAAWMGGVRHVATGFHSTYTVFNGFNIWSVERAWYVPEAFVADVEVSIKNSAVSAWPAVAIQAANFMYRASDPVTEIKGAAYIARDGRNGNCMVAKDPETTPPPPLPIQIKVSAPDWNLGELPQGDASRTFTNSAEQLCFTYTGTAVGGKLFVINAESANGVSNNRYRLKHLEDPTQTVPYKVTLDSGTAKLSLPNGSNTSLALNSSGKTCFAPTFETSVGGRVKDGDYVDTLTFTVVTKT